jgi:hypothetical protein
MTVRAEHLVAFRDQRTEVRIVAQGGQPGWPNRVHPVGRTHVAAARLRIGRAGRAAAHGVPQACDPHCRGPRRNEGQKTALRRAAALGQPAASAGQLPSGQRKGLPPTDFSHAGVHKSASTMVTRASPHCAAEFNASKAGSMSSPVMLAFGKRRSRRSDLDPGRHARSSTRGAVPQTASTTSTIAAKRCSRSGR